MRLEIRRDPTHPRARHGRADSRDRRRGVATRRLRAPPASGRSGRAHAASCPAIAVAPGPLPAMCADAAAWRGSPSSRPAATGTVEAPPATATDARLAGDDKQTRLVIDLSHKIDMRAFTLADPYRVVIDIPQVNFQLPPQDRRARPRPRQGVPLWAGDAGRLAHRHRSRPVRCGSPRPSCSIPPMASRPAWWWTSRRSTATPSCAPPRSTIACRAPPNRRRQPPAIATRIRRQPTDPRPVVVLDPGHGGIDTGTHAPSGELGKEPGARIRHHAARQAREDRQIPGGDDAHR